MDSKLENNSNCDERQQIVVMKVGTSPNIELQNLFLCKLLQQQTNSESPNTSTCNTFIQVAK